MSSICSKMRFAMKMVFWAWSARTMASLGRASNSMTLVPSSFLMVRIMREKKVASLTSLMVICSRVMPKPRKISLMRSWVKGL